MAELKRVKRDLDVLLLLGRPELFYGAPAEDDPLPSQLPQSRQPPPLSFLLRCKNRAGGCEGKKMRVLGRAWGELPKREVRLRKRKGGILEAYDVSRKVSVFLAIHNGEARLAQTPS